MFPGLPPTPACNSPQAPRCCLPTIPPTPSTLPFSPHCLSQAPVIHRPLCFGEAWVQTSSHPSWTHSRDPTLHQSLAPPQSHTSLHSCVLLSSALIPVGFLRKPCSFVLLSSTHEAFCSKVPSCLPYLSNSSYFNPSSKAATSSLKPYLIYQEEFAALSSQLALVVQLVICCAVLSHSVMSDSLRSHGL